MAKIQFSISLAPEVWAQVDDLIPAFGESRGEVITHALNVWWTSHDQDIQARKARISALKPAIKKLLREEQARQRSQRRTAGTSGKGGG